MSSPRTHSQRAARRARRRVTVVFGGLALGLTLMSVLIGSGCIFDDGGYQGGGRRNGAPFETNSAPTTTVPTPTDRDSGGSSSGTSGSSEPPDTGVPDA